MNIERNVSLFSYNSFQVDTCSSFFVDIVHEDELQLVVSSPHFLLNKIQIIGGASNTLFVEPCNKMVVKISLTGIKTVAEDDYYCYLRIGAGVVWDDVVRYCLERNYGGIENLIAIPGSVGAAPIQNIGAYGVEVNQVIDQVEGYHVPNLRKQIFNNADCRFSYRNSIFKEQLQQKFIITAVTLKLHKRPIPSYHYEPLNKQFENFKKEEITIQMVAQAVQEIRAQKLPNPKLLGNAGSFFKNPIVPHATANMLRSNYPFMPVYSFTTTQSKLSAAWLIDQTGFKGKKNAYGTVGCYEKQPLIIVNYGNASGKDILNFSKIVQNEVFKKFEILLEPEVNIVF